ncbi:MAG: hypothetical protein ABSG95_13430 [Solirubrobacteraceae bacterium]|jgi:hypothetical protein
MRALSPRPLVKALVLCLIAFGAVLAGCGKSAPTQRSAGSRSSTAGAAAAHGAVGITTSNTVSLGGGDPASDAAAVARTVYPGLTSATRPGAVVLVDERDWPAALAAATLSGAPLHAPLLYVAKGALGVAGRQALEAMNPVGASALAGAQLIEVGTSVSAARGYRSRTIPAGEPAGVAAALEQLLVLADGGARPRRVIVVSADAPPALVMPAAGLAAESGVPILFASAAGVPRATAAVLSGLGRASIYVVDPAGVGSRTLAELGRYGPVTHITPALRSEGEGPVENAIAVARFTDGTFGWGVKEPGHGLVFANAARPLDAPASALLSATGDYGPLLLLESAAAIPAALARYLGDIQPAYTSAPQFQPVHGVYNHGWLIGGGEAISAVSQARLDSMLEIAPRKPSSEEPSVSSPE